MGGINACSAAELSGIGNFAPKPLIYFVKALYRGCGLPLIWP
jgi:hypothetical protein